jgi:hypothetical protein
MSRRLLSEPEEKTADVEEPWVRTEKRFEWSYPVSVDSVALDSPSV